MAKRNPITREELERSMCQHEGCTNRAHKLIARCHPNGGLAVSFDHEVGALDIRCHTCGLAVCQVAVAKGGGA